ncbi:MAG: GFA family protein [Pseudomonadota bacterium]
MTRTGQCMCGAVRYQANTGDAFNICYCKMCQRWSAGAFMGVPTDTFAVTRGREALTVVRTSDWAERAFCRMCGSNIYYKADPMPTPAVTLGSLDDTSGLTPTRQYYIDRKPDGFSIAEQTETMTEAECIAHFAPDETGDSHDQV